MIRRQVPPVATPLSPLALLRAVPSIVARRERTRRDAAERLAHLFGARGSVLTDSGTAALVLALRAVAGQGRIVALPGYGCIDLVAAAIRAGVRVRLYDVDPRSLSPDLESVRAVLATGVDAIVVAHLYGFAADVVGVAALARERGVAVVEDAAQAAGGTLHGRPLGGFGPLTVLSFGRGKGTSGGGGGALLVTAESGAAGLDELRVQLPAPARGVGALCVATAQLVLGTPALYGIPASIPALRLGEMVYHPAGEPASMSEASAALLARALAAPGGELAHRRRRAAELLSLATRHGVRSIRPIAGCEPGYLRFPILADGQADAAPTLGVVRGYPLALADMAELHPLLMPAQMPTPGASELRDRLLTLPTHSRASAHDRQRLDEWIARSEPNALSGLRRRDAESVAAPIFVDGTNA